MQMLPPSRASETRHILGTVRSVTSPRFIIGPTLRRNASSLDLSSSFASSSSGDSSPSIAKSLARNTTTGIPLSMQVTSTPSIVSTVFPVGSNAPQAEPATSRKSQTIGAALPGTPSISVSPAYLTAPSGVSTVNSQRLPLLTMCTRTCVVGEDAATSPVSMANGPTPARMLPQFCTSVIRRSAGTTCRN